MITPRLFHLAMRILPRKLRDSHGAEILDAFNQERGRILEWRGTLAAGLFVLRASLDLLGAGMRARGSEGREDRGGRVGLTTLFMGMGTDLRQAARSLFRSPGFALPVVTMLALGIGANSAIFSVVEAVLLRPLPYPEAHRLVSVLETREDMPGQQLSLSQPNFLDLIEKNQVFQEIGAFRETTMNLTGDGSPEQVSGAQVTAGFLPALGIEPLLGRRFLPEEDDVGIEPAVAVLSQAVWFSRFGGDPDVLGQTITLDGLPFTVVGIVPSDDSWLDGVDLLVPMSLDPARDRRDRRLVGVGRIFPELTLDRARASLLPLARELAETYPEANPEMGFELIPASQWGASPPLRRGLWLLMGAVGVLLFIACLNLGNLLLARSTNRTRELALCAALGAGRGRLARRGLLESVLLSLVGGTVGLFMGLAGVKLLLSLQPGGIGGVETVQLNGTVLAFTAGMVLLTSFLGCLWPVLQNRSASPGEALREGGRNMTGSRRTRRVQNLLVVVETALSVALLVGAGLLIRSLGQVNRVEQGFDTQQRLTFEVGLSEDYGREESSAFIHAFLDRVRGVPGIRSAGAVSVRPLGGGATDMWVLPAGETQESFGDPPLADWRLITPGYFRAMGAEIIRGRDLSREDDPLQDQIVVSESLADVLWPGEDPLGKRAHLWGSPDRLGTVVGVVGDMRERGPERGPTLAVYLSYDLTAWSPVHFVVHSVGGPEPLVPLLRVLLDQMDPTLPLARVRTLEELVLTTTAQRRFQTLLLAMFAGVALSLVAVGIYGVVSHGVSQRTSEIGVRKALGAASPVVLTQVVREGLTPVSLGLAVGLPSAWALSRVMESLLFQVGGTDVVTYGTVSAILVSAALVACWHPARRALAVHPAEALKG